MGGDAIVAIATVYMLGAYVAAFLAGWFDWDQADFIAVFWPLCLALLAAVVLITGPVLGGVVIYHTAHEMRKRP